MTFYHDAYNKDGKVIKVRIYNKSTFFCLLMKGDSLSPFIPLNSPFKGKWQQKFQKQYMEIILG